MHAIALVVLAWLGFFVLVVSGAFTLMLVVVTMPAYAAALVGYSGLLSAAHEYARGRAYAVPYRNVQRQYLRVLLSDACAAATRAMGTRNGEQET